MVWLYVPGLAASKSGSELHSETVTAASAWSRGKPLRPQRWRAAWSKGGWIRALSGMTSPPSTASRGVATFISSLPVSPASRGVRPASERAPRTSAGCGQTSPASFVKWHPPTSSWRTSAASFWEELDTFSQTWPTSGSLRNGMCFRREAWVPPTGENGSSFWPTAAAFVSGDGEGLETWEARRQGILAKGINGNGMGTPLTIAASTWTTPQASEPDSAERPSRAETGRTTEFLGRQASGWTTPRVATGAYTRDQGDPEKERMSLEGEASLWQTPNLPNGGGKTRGGERGDELLLEGQAAWFTPAATDHKGSTAPGQRRGQLSEQTETPSRQAQATPDGETSSPSPRGSRPRLNPAFVCWLMGWPWWWTNPEWTSCEQQATEWYRGVRRWLSAFCGDDFGAGRDDG